MLRATEEFADPTEESPFARVVDETLRSLRISGSLLLRESYAPPWGISIPTAARLGELLGVGGGGRGVAFHLVELGHCQVSPTGGDEILLRAGEMAIGFGGAAHSLSQGTSPRVIAVETLLAGGPNVRRPDASGAHAGASLLCGVFVLHQPTVNPLFTALPPLMRVDLSRPGELHNLSGAARLLAEEVDRTALAGGYVVERLLEVLCAQAVRAYIESVPAWDRSWFRAIKDPVVGRAIATIHAHPGEPWTVQRLAAHVAMSPSRLAARFAESLGESPMAYVAR